MINLSILVPAFGRQARIDDTLVSLLENRPQGSEVVLVHPSDYRDPYDLGDEVRFVASDQESLLGLVNDGVEACRGHVVHILAPGITASAGWCDGVLELFASDRNIGAVIPQLRTGKRRALSGLSYSRTWGQILSTSHQQPGLMVPTRMAGFYQRSAFRFMRGFSIELDSLAEIELGLRLWAAGYKLVPFPECELSGSYSLPKPPTGYLGGKRRGRLQALASQLELDTLTWKQGCWSEFLIHRGFPSWLMGAWGRIQEVGATVKRAPQPPALELPSTSGLSSAEARSERRRKAA